MDLWAQIRWHGKQDMGIMYFYGFDRLMNIMGMTGRQDTKLDCTIPIEVP